MSLPPPKAKSGERPAAPRSWAFVIAFIVSGLLHILVALAARYITVEASIEPPKMRAVIVEMVSFESGASSDRISHAEPLSARARQAAQQQRRKPQHQPQSQRPQSQSAKREKGEKSATPQSAEPEAKPENGKSEQSPPEAAPPQSTKTAPVLTAPQSAKTIEAPPAVQPAIHQIKPVRPASVSQSKPVAKPKPKKQEKPNPKPKTQKTKTSPPKPKAKKPSASKAKIKKPGKPRRKTSSQKKKHKKNKRKASKGSPGRGLKKKGKAKTGRTQGVRFYGAGLSNPRPPYPPGARRRNQQGRVLLRVRVSARGRALSVRVSRSSGYKLLDSAALRTVRRWRFRPAMKNGKPVPATVIVPITFRLRN